MTGPDDLAERLAALESRIAYQDETIETLNRTVTAQWSDIDRLKRHVALLEDRVDDAANGAGPVDRPPPHY
ncbi:SlyX family protein [Methylopila sp. M107]|uniref:SlyX family protein n=1 Tax=Methylopila sp. M107 TaxID=1101190 RepID=UPI00037200C3|nr:SlyX family protein [Methylopila sp. M107]